MFVNSQAAETHVQIPPQCWNGKNGYLFLFSYRPSENNFVPTLGWLLRMTVTL